MRGRHSASTSRPLALRRRLWLGVTGILVAGTVTACSGHRLTAVKAPDADAGLGNQGAGGADPPSQDAEEIDSRPGDAGLGDVADAVVDGPPMDVTPAGGRRRVPYRVLALAGGKYHTCALLDDHNVKCWGYNAMGELGLGDSRNRGATAAEMGDALPPVDLGRGRTAKFIAAGRYATCAVLDDDAVKCWGWAALLGQSFDENRGDGPGEMGDNLPIVNLAGRVATRIAMTANDACALLSEGSVICWRGGPPTLGRPARSPGVVDLVDAFGMCAVFDDGTVERPAGVLAAPLNVGDQPVRFVAGYEMNACAALRSGGWGCWSTPNVITLRSETTPVSLSVGLTHHCALLDRGEVRCTRMRGPAMWNDETMPTTENGSLVRLGKPAIALANAGEDHTCALLVDQTVRCWGWPAGHAILGGSAPTSTDWPAIDLGTRVVDP